VAGDQGGIARGADVVAGDQGRAAARGEVGVDEELNQLVGEGGNEQTPSEASPQVWHLF
jgi:hypothetical protein